MIAATERKNLPPANNVDTAKSFPMFDFEKTILNLHYGFTKKQKKWQ